MRYFKYLAAGAIAAVLGISVIPANAANTAGSTGNGSSNSTAYGVYPQATPSLNPNDKSPLTLDQNGNLNVNVRVGGSGQGATGVFPAPSSAPFPVSAATTIPVTITGSSGTGSGALGSVIIGAGTNAIGSVTVSNFPVTQPVSVATTIPVSISGTQPVSIATTVPVNITNAGIAVNNFPATQNVNVTNTVPVSIATTIPIIGNVGVTGTVAVSNFPATQPVSIATTVPVSGSLTVTNFPATQPVSIATTVPVSIATTVPVACVSGCTGSGGGGTSSQYNTVFPTYTNGQNTVNQSDQNGLQILSPRNIIGAAPGAYFATPQPLIDGERTTLLTDVQGRAQVGFATPQPVYLAPENRMQTRYATFLTNTTSILFADAEPSRRGFYVQNLCPNPIWLNFNGDPAVLDNAPAIRLGPNELYESPLNLAVTSTIFLFSRTTGCSYSGATY